MNKNALSWCSDLVLLSVLLLVIFGSFLGYRQLTVPDEARYAEIPREMVTSGDYVTPHLNAIKYFQKPPLFYWLQAGAIKSYGLSEWAVRLPNMLLAVFGCLVTYITARNYYGRRCGWLASTLLASSALYFIMAQYITLDMSVSVLLTATLCSFLLGIRASPGWPRTAYFLSIYIFAALATLTKGLIGIIFPGMIIFVWLCLTRRWRELKTYHLLSGSFIFLLIALPWHIVVQMRNPEFFNYYVIEQQFLRYFTDYAGREKPLWYLPFFVIGGLTPWVGFLVQAINHHWNKSWRELFKQNDTVFLFLWIILIYLFFQVSHSQLPPYILPIFPPLAILIARYLDLHWNKPLQQGIKYGFIISALLGTITAIGTFLLPLFIKTSLPFELRLTAISAGLLLAIATLLALKVYTKYGLARAYVILAIAACSFLSLNLNVVYPPLDPKTIKPLALQINTLYQAGDKIVSYHSYYQDLPYYTRQPSIIVNWNGEELAFGMQHQDVTKRVISDNAFWQLWHSPQRLFLVLSKEDYAALRTSQLVPYYLLGETQRNVLLINQPVKSANKS